MLSGDVSLPAQGENCAVVCPLQSPKQSLSQTTWVPFRKEAMERHGQEAKAKATPSQRAHQGASRHTGLGPSWVGLACALILSEIPLQTRSLLCHAVVFSKMSSCTVLSGPKRSDYFSVQLGTGGVEFCTLQFPHVMELITGTFGFKRCVR